MHTRSMGSRALRALLIAALATATLAPAAAAGAGRVRYKIVPRGHAPHVLRVGHRHPVFIERHSDVGAMVGFLGGLVVGSVLSNAPPPPAYAYFDPYCHERFAAIEAYEAHLDRHRHPCRVEVIEVHSGRCVDTWCWRDGRWRGDEEGPGDDEWED